MTTERELKKRVKKGIEFLDNEIPDWKQQIKLDELDLGKCRKCILGQLFGDYENGLNELDILYSSASDYGFTLSYEVMCTQDMDEIRPGFIDLTNAWRELLK